MKEKIKTLIDELCAGYEARIKAVLAEAQAAITTREAGVKRREENLNGILKQHALELATANARARDMADRLTKEKSTHNETREKLDAARKEIEVLRPLVRRKPAEEKPAPPKEVVKAEAK